MSCLKILSCVVWPVICYTRCSFLYSTFSIRYSIFNLQFYARWDVIRASLYCWAYYLYYWLAKFTKMFFGFLNCLLFTDRLKVYLMSHHPVRSIRCVCVTIYVVFHTTLLQLPAHQSWFVLIVYNLNSTISLIASF